MKALLFLQNETRAFRLTSELIDDLKNAFPAWTFVNASNEDEVERVLPETDVFVTWIFRSHWYLNVPKLKAIFTPAAGKDWIALNPLHHIPVFHGSFHGPLMAESLLGMILFFNRRMDQSLIRKSEKVWERDYLSSTSMLGSQHSVIVGYGRIGREFGRVLKALGCGITGVRRDPRRHVVYDRDADTIVGPDQLIDIIGDADHVVSILPGGCETDHLFTRKHFSAMKRGACFYNLGRGNVYDEKDLTWALTNNVIAGAGLDVFAEEPLDKQSVLWNLPNVFIMPHGSAIFKEYMPMFIEELKTKLKAFV